MTSQMKVLGAGFGRTGTKSLKHALEVLGFGPCHHMHELAQTPRQLGIWQDVASGKTIPWPEVFYGYQSQVDWPGAFFWRELADEYPDAKMILTVRQPEDWYESFRRTIAVSISSRSGAIRPDILGMREVAYELVGRRLFKEKMGDKDAVIRLYEDHNRQVIREIPESRLLVYDVKDGWPPLCEFLDVANPQVPFEKANSTTEFRKFNAI